MPVVLRFCECTAGVGSGGRAVRTGPETASGSFPSIEFTVNSNTPKGAGLHRAEQSVASFGRIWTAPLDADCKLSHKASAKASVDAESKEIPLDDSYATIATVKPSPSRRAGGGVSCRTSRSGPL
jgi:hypothetical protein